MDYHTQDRNSLSHAYFQIFMVPKIINVYNNDWLHKDAFELAPKRSLIPAYFTKNKAIQFPDSLNQNT